MIVRTRYARRVRRAAVFVLSWTLLLVALAASSDLRPTIILVSLDGWRWDYDQYADVPALRSLSERGVRAAHLISSFPTKTFPNHYTIVTGLYPGHHGIVANNIRDPTTGRMFSMGARKEVQDPMWWGGEPIWVTLRRAGQLSAPLFWVGSEAPIGGAHARYWKSFDEKLSGPALVDQVLRWLDLPASERPTFLTLYFSDVDTAGHAHGPESRQVREAIARVDGYLGRLLSGLQRRRLLDRVNIVVTSDHGMSATSRERVIFIDDYLTSADGQIVDLNPGIGIVPPRGAEAAVFAKLQHAHPHLSVYRREATPPHWHYRDHPRIPPIVGVADDGWLVMERKSVIDFWKRNVRGVGGMHGYDPAAASMWTLFVAAGPAFRRGVVVPPFENVHIYNALCYILGVTPAANDGDPLMARQLLANPVR